MFVQAAQRSGHTRRRAGGPGRWSAVLGGLLVVVTLVQAVAGTAFPASAQPAAEPSPEETTILLLPYLFPASEAPAGYGLTATTGYSSDAAAFDAVMLTPPDPRPMEEVLAFHTSVGRIVRLYQGFEHTDDADAPELAFVVAAFASPDGAATAPRDASRLLFFLPDATVTSIEAPALGTAVDGAAGYVIDQPGDEESGPERTVVLAWQRGRLVFSVLAFGAPDAATAALPALAELAARSETRIAGLPALPAELPGAPSFMPPAERRLDLYKSLAERLPADDAFGADMATLGAQSISNALIVLDSPRAAAPASDPRFVADRLLTSERRILGVGKQFDPADSDPDTPSTLYPTISVGYHLYADADGAREALGASPAEIALRVNEETYLLNDPTRQAVADTTSVLSRGEQTRALTGWVTLDDGTEIELTTVRWRRGAVELYANVAGAVGEDVGDLLRAGVERLDGAYSSRPLP